jgi:hypothetical protein
MPNNAKKKKPSPWTMYMDEPQREKIMRLQGHFMAQGERISGGCILRAILDQAPENSPEFFEKVKAFAEKEGEVKLKKFQESLGAKPRAKRPKT